MTFYRLTVCLHRHPADADGPLTPRCPDDDPRVGGTVDGEGDSLGGTIGRLNIQLHPAAVIGKGGLIGAHAPFHINVHAAIGGWKMERARTGGMAAVASGIRVEHVGGSVPITPQSTFMFTGQGPQYLELGSGRPLAYKAHPPTRTSAPAAFDTAKRTASEKTKLQKCQPRLMLMMVSFRMGQGFFSKVLRWWCRPHRAYRLV
jgi:hypothetical protein